MSVICSRCRGVFYSNAEYVNHRCGVELVPRDASKGKEEAAQAETPKALIESTKGRPIQERLQKLCPDDRTGHIHESMTVFQSLVMHLADKTHLNEKVVVAAVDVRCLILGLHAMCDRIEELQGVGVKP